MASPAPFATSPIVANGEFALRQLWPPLLAELNVYGAFVAILGAGCVALAASERGVLWLLLWPGLTFLAVGGAYALRWPEIFGKRPDGTLDCRRAALFAPFLAFTEFNWNVYRLATREPAFSEVAPGLWVGRWPRLSELPAEAAIVVDVTAELRVRDQKLGGREYLSLPALDSSAPDTGALCALLVRLQRDPRGIYVHCAFGHGRSAAVAAALLLARGVVHNLDDAEAMMKRVRPRVRLNGIQRETVLGAIRQLRDRPVAA